MSVRVSMRVPPVTWTHSHCTSCPAVLHRWQRKIDALRHYPFQVLRLLFMRLTYYTLLAMQRARAVTLRVPVSPGLPVSDGDDLSMHNMDDDICPDDASDQLSVTSVEEAAGVGVPPCVVRSPTISPRGTGPRTEGTSVGRLFYLDKTVIGGTCKGSDRYIIYSHEGHVVSLYNADLHRSLEVALAAEAASVAARTGRAPDPKGKRAAAIARSAPSDQGGLPGRVSGRATRLPEKFRDDDDPVQHRQAAS